MSIDDLPNYKQYFYDPATGRMFKEVNTFSYNMNKGRSSAVQYKISGAHKLSTHLIHLIMTGRWPHPGMHMDHKNGNPEDNRWNNLREATPQQNVHNSQPWRSDKHGLAKGVRLTKSGKFEVQIKADGKFTSFGTYSTKEEANEIAIAQRKVLHKDFAFENRPLNRRF